MAAHGAAAQLPASNISTGLSVDGELREYEKILKISDDIFSGTHPRLKVPQQFVRKPAARDPPTSHAPKEQTSKYAPLAHPPPPERYLQTVARGKEPANFSPSAMEPSGASTMSRVAPKTPSEIDPIFLTKSEELVRAELQLQRGRVERALREQLEHRRQESKQKVALQDAKPDFNVSDVLARAFELVRPSPPSETHGLAKVPSDSFDDNSLYSSRAPDSPPSAKHQRPSPPPRAENLATDAPVYRYADELHRLEALNNSGSDLEMQDTYPATDQRLPYHQKLSYKSRADYATNKFSEPSQPADSFEEPEYSPPAPGVPPMERTDSREYQGVFAGGGRRQEPDYQFPDRRRYGRKSLSPPNDVRIVRNHITSPAAPRPSRVSPLATAKVPSSHRLKASQPTYGSDRPGVDQDMDRGSPDAPAPSPRYMSRKRRRVHEERDGPRRVSSRRQAVEPSEPFIKQEPVSPPPFADDPPNIRSRPRQERPVYIDIASPRHTPVMERREPLIREPAYEHDPYEAPVDPGVPRTLSRLSVRRPARDDQDLRRVASLHHARQPEYPREDIDQSSQRPVQPAPYTVVERPQEKSRYYDEPAAPYSRRYVPVDEPDFSPNYRETYFDEDVPARIMAPPQRRIVVDEQGNQYYETLPAPKMQPMPPPYTRMPRGDIYEDQPPLRQASVRAGSVVQDPYSGRRYVQEMPPPATAYRRVTDYARPPLNERRSYAMPVDDREAFPRSSSVQVGEYPARRTAYVDEPEVPRERVIRMASVRPPPTRYEEPAMYQRVESMHPGSRAMSTFVEDDSRRPREYIERPTYLDARPRRRDTMMEMDQGYS